MGEEARPHSAGVSGSGKNAVTTGQQRKAPLQGIRKRKRGIHPAENKKRDECLKNYSYSGALVCWEEKLHEFPRC